MLWLFGQCRKVAAGPHLSLEPNETTARPFECTYLGCDDGDRRRARRRAEKQEERGKREEKRGKKRREMGGFFRVFIVWVVATERPKARLAADVDFKRGGAFSY